MRTLTKLFVAVAALFVSFACATDATDDLGVKIGGSTTLTISLEESRTQLGEKADGVYPLYWSEGDQISVNGIASNALTAEQANSSIAAFTISGGVNFPYKIAYPAAPIYHVLFATQQSYVSGTFANDASTMYAYSESGGDVQLKHLTGVLKIGVTGDKNLVLAQVSTIDRTPIAGPFVLDFTTGEVTATTASKSVIEYSFGKGVKLSNKPTYLHIAVPAGQYDELYVTLYDTEGGVMYATVKAGDSKPLSIGNVREFRNNISYAPTANVYVIRDKESLKGFAAAVNATGSAYTNDALMVADVDMTGEEWTSLNWKSASKNTDGFLSLATFHGNGYAIKGLTAPLFDTLTANVKGLHLRDVNINETVRADVGSLARWFQAANFAADPTKATAADIAKPVISHCSASGKLTIECKEFAYDKNRPLAAYGPFSSGGLIAVCRSGNIEDCVNEIDIDIKQIVASWNATTLHPRIGGIVGFMESINTSVYIPETVINLRRLVNKGDISYHDPYATFTISDYSKLSAIVGGVAGANASKAYACEIVDLKNYGNISLTGSLGNDTMVGGVLGRPAAANVKNIYNYGKLTMDSGSARRLYIGGVFGYSPSVLENNYDNIHNYGEVEVKNIEVYALCVGGVFGAAMSNYSYAETNIISNSANSAPVTVENVNQLSGLTAGAHFRVGGFSAWIQHVMEDCVNNKEGVVNVKNCTIFNAESGLNALCIGGVVGHKSVYCANRCVNYAPLNVNAAVLTNDDVTMETAGYVRMNIGGCFGWRGATVGDSCVNDGDITVGGYYEGSLVVGGMCGCSNGTLENGVWTNCENNGKITILDDTFVIHATDIGGVFGWTQNGAENITNNGEIYIGKNLQINYASHFGGLIGYVAKTTTNFKNLINTGNIDIVCLIYTAAPYVGGCIGYASENEDSGMTSYPNVDGIHQYGKVAFNGKRPARSVWKDELTTVATLRTGAIAGFLGGTLNNANVYEQADFSINIENVTPFTPKDGESIDCGNVQFGYIAYHMKDHAKNCTSRGNFTFTGKTKGTLYTGMFGAPHNYSRINCINYGSQTIDGTTSTNCYPSQMCYDGKANATWQDCHNYGDIIIGSKATTEGQLRAGIFYAKCENEDMITVLDGCSNSGDIIVQDGARIRTDCRLGLAVGCHVRGSLLIRNGYTNTGNIVFSGACNRKLADRPLSLGGIIGYSSSLGTGDSNTASYSIASATTVGGISYPAGSWTGNVVNIGNITYDGTSTTGVCIGGIIGTITSIHTTSPFPVGAKMVFTGKISATGTYATDIVDSTDSATTPCRNGIGGVYGFSNLERCIVENAEVYSTINAVNYPNIGMLFGFNRTSTVYGKNCKIGGSITSVNSGYRVINLTSNNFINHLYSAGSNTDWSGTKDYDSCTFLSVAPTY